jgi:hypothetical protein
MFEYRSPKYGHRVQNFARLDRREICSFHIVGDSIVRSLCCTNCNARIAFLASVSDYRHCFSISLCNTPLGGAERTRKG